MTSPSSALPSLTIVTGRPGSGKTTLSRRLAPIIHCPLISRDDLKEGIVNTTGDKGEPAGPLTLEVYSLFFDTIESLLRHRVSLVAEAAFQRKNWAPKLDPLIPHAKRFDKVVLTEPRAAQGGESLATRVSYAVRQRRELSFRSHPSGDGVELVQSGVVCPRRASARLGTSRLALNHLNLRHLLKTFCMWYKSLGAH